MILIIGGICQGKHDFCRNEFPDAEVIDHYEERVRREMKEGKEPLSEAEKWLESIAVIDTKSKPDEGDASREETEDYSSGCPSKKSASSDISGVHFGNGNSGHIEKELVIIMNEVGSGVVPMDRDERLWREAVGRVSCLYAKRADRVYRLIAGIPQRLK